MSRRFSPQPHSVLTRYTIASTLLLAAALLIAPPVSAQDQPTSPSAADPELPTSGQLNIRGTLGIPQGGLRSNISGPGGGIHLALGGWVGRRPLLIGGDIGFINYGRTTDRVPFSSTVGPRVPVDVSTRNNVVETHLSLRLQPRTGRFRPYVEGLVGFKYLFTRTEIEGVDAGDESDDDIAGTTNYDDFAFSGGTGAGVDVRVFQQNKPTEKVRAVDLHLGVQYLWGSEAEYLAEGDLADENENGRLDRSELDVRRSRTTFLQPQVGVTLRFGSTDED